MARSKATAFVPAALAAMFLAHADVLAQGCAMCGTVASGAKDPLVKGLAYSIALMLAVPNVLIASIGGWLFYVYRRAAFRTAGANALNPEIVTVGDSDGVSSRPLAPGHLSDIGDADLGPPTPCPTPGERN